ncbi:flavodoxin family protein [Oceanicaulis sp. LC35]|uniref:flavodoxin family protein n=1 Tax=Oceanicaulis sp. LC35 TaxID=3349635 RepID=UPI003F85671C
MQVQIAIVYHSGYGHTQVLAQSVARGAEAGGADVALIQVTEITEADWAVLERADAIIFGSPTYMGAVSGPFKIFMDQSSAVWMQRGWADKLAAGFTVSGSMAGDKFATLSQLSTLAAQHGMLWVSLNQMPGNNLSTASADDLNRVGASLGVMAQANNDQGPDLVPPKADHLTAEKLGERVSRLALRFRLGQPASA